MSSSVWKTEGGRGAWREQKRRESDMRNDQRKMQLPINKLSTLVEFYFSPLMVVFFLDFGKGSYSTLSYWQRRMRRRKGREVDQPVGRPYRHRTSSTPPSGRCSFDSHRTLQSALIICSKVSLGLPSSSLPSTLSPRIVLNKCSSSRRTT